MDHNLNNLAIILTKQLEADISMLCHEVTKADETTITQAPNFWMIREKILSSLHKYMDSIYVSVKDSPRMMREVPPRIAQEIVNAQLEKAAHDLVTRIMDSPEHFAKYTYQDEWDNYRSVNRSIIVLKTEKIRKDADR